MKRVTFTLVLALVLSLQLNAPATAVIKAGTACSKVKSTKVVSGLKLTCVKSGNKLIWKASTIQKTNQNQPTEKMPASPTSFKDIEAHLDGIPYSSWSGVQANIKAFTEPKTKVSMFFGPNTPKRYPVEVTEKMVLLGSRAMARIPQPSEVKFYSFNKLDVSWAKEIATKWVSPFRLGESLPQQAEKMCAGEDCDGGITNYVSGFGAVLVGVSTPVTRYGDLARFNGQNDLHEYVHAVQGIIFADKTSGPPPTLIPCWYSEGQPQAVSIITSAATMQDYLKLRTQWLKTGSWPLPDTSAQTIEKFLADNMKVPCPGATNFLNYTAGYIVMETLISVGGVEKTFDLLKKVADGSSFESAFESEYSLPWAEAAPIVARIVSKAVTAARK
jgi:hypothetical protein